MDVLKYTNFIANKYSNRVKKYKAGFIQQNKLTYKDIIFNCLYVVLNNEAFVDESDKYKLIDLINV